MSYATRNYMAHGGEELVIGGKLTFLPGATVEGTEGLFDSNTTAPAPQPAIADSTANSVTALRTDLNTLLAVLRTVGILATVPTDQALDAPSE